MGYQVHPEGDKGAWYVLFQKDHGWKVDENGNRKRHREQYKVKKTSVEFHELKFRKDMTLKEAKEHAASLNARAELEAIQAKARKADEKKKLDALIVSAFLPPDMVQEFESTVIVDKRIREPHWRTAKKLIATLDFPPSKWFWRQDAILNLFVEKQFSPDYSNTILKLINLWGYWYSDRMNTAWKDIKFPKGMRRKQIERAYHKKTGGRESIPVTMQMLNERKENMLEEHFNWIYITMWFGLRPREADMLANANPDKWAIDTTDQRFTILRVYQEKLEADGVEALRCWKAIPVVVEEQRLALEMIRSGKLKRPSNTWFRKRMPKRVTAYSGRKHFIRMLQERGFNKACRQKWMGHLTGAMADRAYEDPSIVTYEAPTTMKKSG